MQQKQKFVNEAFCLENPIIYFSGQNPPLFKNKSAEKSLNQLKSIRKNLFNENSSCFMSRKDSQNLPNP